MPKYVDDAMSGDVDTLMSLGRLYIQLGISDALFITL